MTMLLYCYRFYSTEIRIGRLPFENVNRKKGVCAYTLVLFLVSIQFWKACSIYNSTLLLKSKTHPKIQNEKKKV